MENVNVKGKETADLIDKINSGNNKILIPICDDLAFIDCEVIDNKRCKVHLGGDFYVETSFKKAKEILKRKIKEEIKNNSKINDLDGKTFEILEQYDEEEEKKKKKENEKKKKEKEKEINTSDKEKEIEERSRKMLEKLTNYEPPNENIIYKELKLLPGKEIIKKLFKQLKI